jgi:cardiolipin synthase
MRFTLWLLTLARLLLIPIFLWVASDAQRTALSGGDAATARWTAMSILIVMGLSDVVDGLIARRYGLETQLGAVVDAVADKLAQFVFLVYFAVTRGPVFTQLPLWFVGVILGRDLLGLVTWLTFRAHYGPIEVVHRWHGRATTGAVAFVLVCAVLRVPGPWLLPVLAATGVFAVLSGFAYFFEGRARGRELAASGS